jgi:ribonuclease Z
MRIIVALAGVAFSALGIGFWVAPEDTGRIFSLEAIGTSGLVALRADLGGTFAALGILCLASAVSRRASVATAAALVVGAIVVGRLIGMAGGVVTVDQIAMLACELAICAVLVTYAQRVRTAGGAATGGRRPAIVAGGVMFAVTAVGGAVLLNPRAELAIFEQAAQGFTGRVNTSLFDDDALRVAICGSSAPLPSARRAKACAAIFAGGKYYLVDVGPESVENLVLWGIPLDRIGGVLLTHFHSDHIGDLGELQLQTWAGGRPAPLKVYGGPGVERLTNGFNEAYRQDQGYRTAHHTSRVMPAETWGLEPCPVALEGAPTPERSRTATVLDDGGLRITAIEVNHAPIQPAYAYRFDYKGRSVVVSGDLKYHAPLATAAQGADVLVIEAISRPMIQALKNAASAIGSDRRAAIMHDIQDYHIDPVEAATIANDAAVKLLVFYHLLPAPDSFITRRLFAHDVTNKRSSGWTIADDSSLYTLPLGSHDVRIGRVAN